jgi:hypothetical protein
MLGVLQNRPNGAVHPLWRLDVVRALSQSALQLVGATLEQVLGVKCVEQQTSSDLQVRTRRRLISRSIICVS